MLVKRTVYFAKREDGLKLHCDLYIPDDCRRDIVVLYFHPGGLMEWGPECIAPWLVQVCVQRRWPLISASYRLMPGVQSEALTEDAKEAYFFARTWRHSYNKPRRVIVAGASAGFFLACQTVFSLPKGIPPPVALFSIQGISTFRHPFYTSNNMITPELPFDWELRPFFQRPPTAGKNPPDAASTFVLEKLLPSGARNPEWTDPVHTPSPQEVLAGKLYAWFTAKSEWRGLLEGTDKGFEWAREDRKRVAEWPRTVILHGDMDTKVALDVSLEMWRRLGKDKVSIVIAPGQNHLFELTKFIEDEGEGMDAVREAVARLDRVVAEEMGA